MYNRRVRMGLRGSGNVARGSTSTPPGVFHATTIIKMMQQFRSSGCSNLSVPETPLRQRDHTVSQQGSCGCSCAANIQLGMAKQTKTRLEEANIYINALNNPTLHE